MTESDLVKAFEVLEQQEKERLSRLEHKPTLFTRIMNYFGWYRRQAVVVIDTSAVHLASHMSEPGTPYRDHGLRGMWGYVFANHKARIEE